MNNLFIFYVALVLGFGILWGIVQHQRSRIGALSASLAEAKKTIAAQVTIIERMKKREDIDFNNAGLADDAVAERLSSDFRD